MKDKVISIIANVFGDSTAQMYKEYYRDKDDLTILSSLKEILSETLGELKTREIFKEYKFEEKQ